MKTILKILGLMLLMVSCNTQNKKDNTVDETVKMGKTVQDLAKQSQDLKETEPVSEETLNNWFPKTLQGMERQKIVKGTLTGYGISGATATYEGSDKSRLVVNVNDGAGEKGTMLTSQYIAFKNLNTDSETDTFHASNQANIIFPRPYRRQLGLSLGGKCRNPLFSLRFQYFL